MGIHLDLEINKLEELEGFFYYLKSKKNDDFYTDVFRYLIEYDLSDANSSIVQEYNNCCWELVKHINFYNLEKICFKLYNYVSSNKDCLNKKIFIDCLKDEFYYDSDNEFDCDEKEKHFIFSNFLKYSIYSNNFEIAADMICCDNEKILVNEVLLMISNKQYDVLNNLCKNVEEDTFTDIFNLMLKHNSEEINKKAIEMYKAYNDL